VFTHAAAATECEVDDVDTVDVDNCERSSAPFRVSTRVEVIVAELYDMSNGSETAILEKSARPFLKHVRLLGTRR